MRHLIAQVLKAVLIISPLTGQAQSKPPWEKGSCPIRSQDGGLTTCQTAVSMAQTEHYVKFYFPLTAAFCSDVDFLCQKCHCCLVSFISVSLIMITCKSQHKELGTFCSPWLLKEMVFISPIQLAYQHIPRQLLWPPVIHILSTSAMAGPPAFRSGHLLRPELWGMSFTEKLKIVIVWLLTGLGH